MHQVHTMVFQTGHMVAYGGHGCHEVRLQIIK